MWRDAYVLTRKDLLEAAKATKPKEQKSFTFEEYIKAVGQRIPASKQGRR